MMHLAARVEEAADNGEWRASLAILEGQWPELWAKRRQPAPAAGPSVTIELVLQIAANVVALGAPVEPLQLVEQIAHAVGLTSGGNATPAQGLPAPALNESAEVQIDGKQRQLSGGRRPRRIRSNPFRRAEC